MITHARTGILTIAALALAMGTATFAQPADGGGQGATRGGDRGGDRGAARGGDNDRMRQRGEEFQREREARLKEQLKVTDEEWQAIGPKIDNVRRLQMQSLAGMMGGRRGGPGGFGGGQQPAQGGESAPESALVKASRELGDAVRSDTTTPEQFKKLVENVRTARQKAAADVEAARKELRELVTVRQEAVLVSMGILD